MEKDMDGIAGELMSVKLERFALGVVSTTSLVLGLPGLAVGFIGHAISGNGFSIAPSMRSINPLEIVGAALGIVGNVLGATMLLKSLADARLAKLNGKLSKTAISCQEDARRLAKEGRFEDLTELLTAVGGGKPLARPEFVNVAMALFEDAAERDDPLAIERCLGLSGGKFRFHFSPNYGPKDMFGLAASKGAKACCSEFMRQGVDSCPGSGVPWEQAKNAGHKALQKELYTYHCKKLQERPKGVIGRIARKF